MSVGIGSARAAEAANTALGVTSEVKRETPATALSVHVREPGIVIRSADVARAVNVALAAPSPARPCPTDAT